MTNQINLFTEARKTGLGGSDAGAIYNLGFKCARRTTYEKRGIVPDYPIPMPPEFERGNIMESVVLSLYVRRTGRPVKVVPMLRHPDHEWMIVNLDGSTECLDHEGPGVVEFKVLNRFIYKRFKTEGVRDEYILQLQWGMAVTGYKWGSFGLLCLDPWEFQWFDVERDDAIIQKLIEDGEVLWGKIQNGPLPEPLEKVNDKRCRTCPWRKACRGAELLESLPDSEQTEGDKVAIRDDSLAPLVSECVELGELKDEATELETEARTKLKDAIGKRYGVIVPGFRALYPPSWPERWDTPALVSLKAEAEKALEITPFEQDELEASYKLFRKLLESFVKAKKPKPKEPQYTLRIYSTGD